jgi:hypothetical protein
MQIPFVGGTSSTRALVTVSVLFLLSACDTPTAPPAAAPRTAASRSARDLSAFDPCNTGQLSSGASWEICLPGTWNGSLIVWAHGYRSPFLPLAIPDDEVDGTPIKDIVLGLGFAYATTSYRSNGLAAVDGSYDVEDLLAEFASLVGVPARAYLVGASEGSLSSILALERSTTHFSGGLTVCGPIGYFRGQINYLGDFRVLFDYFFPGVLPGSAIQIPQQLIDHWDDVYVPAVLAALAAHPSATQQLLRVSHAPIDPNDPNTIGETASGILWYNVFGTNEASTRLGGNPYDNRTRLYLGSDNDLRLNLTVKRYAASSTALANLRAFETSGLLQRPAVSLHTTGDPIIPFWQQTLYQFKTLAAPSPAPFVGFPVSRYGHCTFTESEVLAGFALLVQETGGTLTVPAGLLPDRTAQSQFLELARARGANPTVGR